MQGELSAPLRALAGHHSEEVALPYVRCYISRQEHHRSVCPPAKHQAAGGRRSHWIAHGPHMLYNSYQYSREIVIGTHLHDYQSVGKSLFIACLHLLDTGLS